MGFDKARN
jgi:hypothetical protein